MIDRLCSSAGRGATEDRAGGSAERETRFYTIADVAELVQVAPRSVRRWIRSGQLAAHRFGSIVRISESDLASFLDQHRQDKSKTRVE